MSASNPYISWETRRWLYKLSQEQFPVIDAPSRENIQKALDRSSVQAHPGGLVYDVSKKIGALESQALVAGSLAELFFAAVNLTDDMQDGDSSYMDIPMSLQINTQSHMFSLAVMRSYSISDKIANIMFTSLSKMFVGQRLELVTTLWDYDTYYEVAKRVAGEQFALYFNLAAISGGSDNLENWYNLGMTYGIILQIIHDKNSLDERYISLSNKDKSNLFNRALDDLECKAEICGSIAIEYCQNLVSLFKG